MEHQSQPFQTSKVPAYFINNLMEHLNWTKVHVGVIKNQTDTSYNKPRSYVSLLQSSYQFCLMYYQHKSSKLEVNDGFVSTGVFQFD